MADRHWLPAGTNMVPAANDNYLATLSCRRGPTFFVNHGCRPPRENRRAGRKAREGLTFYGWEKLMRRICSAIWAAWSALWMPELFDGAGAPKV